MEGEFLKNELRRRKISVSEVARRLGVPPQNLSSALSNGDIKTGVLEDVAKAIGVSPAVFYNGDSGGVAVVGEVHGSTVIGRQDGATEALVKQLDVKDEQIDRLLGLLEKK